MAKISISIYVKGDYEEITTVWARKNKPNSKHALSAVEWANLVLALRPVLGVENNLKKQSQFIRTVYSVQRTA